nr:hypothetical protein GCM10020093_115500 [Planobispora longispora]
MEVDRPPSDGVAADQRHERLARQVQQRAEHQDGDAVEARERGGHVGVDLRPLLDDDLARGDLHIDAQRAQHLRGDADFAHVGGIVDHALAAPSMAATMCLETPFLDPRTSTSPRSGPEGSISHTSSFTQTA